MTSGIEWTEDTWNPLTGCSVASTGCDRCYAAREAAGRLNTHPAYAGLAIKGPDGLARFTGEVRTLPDRLTQPLRWTRPRLVFVNSMSDLFHPEVPTDFIVQVYAAMAVATKHTFQLLTKRPKRRALLLANPDFAQAVRRRADQVLRAAPSGGWRGRSAWESDVVWPLPNVWEGVSVEHQDTSWRLDQLMATPAAVRWVSAEPLVGPLDLDRWVGPDLFVTDDPRLDWVVVGGESGRDPGVRPMHPDWARKLRDQCTMSGTPFLFKQWGEWAPARAGIPEAATGWVAHSAGRSAALMERVGTKAAGRQLDGVTHDGYPERVRA